MKLRRILSTILIIASFNESCAMKRLYKMLQKKVNSRMIINTNITAIAATALAMKIYYQKKLQDQEDRLYTIFFNEPGPRTLHPLKKRNESR